MARIRSIHPSKRGRKEFLRMSLEGLAAWEPLQTLCDDWGVFRWEPEELEAEIFPRHRIDLGPVLEEWERLGLVRSFAVDGQRYGAVRDFCVEQSPKKPRPWYPLTRELVSFVGADQKNGAGQTMRPARELAGASEQVAHGSRAAPMPPESGAAGAEAPASGSGSEPVGNEFGTGSEPVPDRFHYGEERRGGESGIRNLDSDSECARARSAFDRLRAVWARLKRQGDDPMPAAEQAFQRLLEAGADPDAIVAGAERFAEAERRNVGTPYVPMLVHWLNRGSFQQYPPPQGAAPPAPAPAEPEDERWAPIGKQLRRALGDDNYASWFAGKVRIVALEEKRIVLGFPTPFLRDYVRSNFSSQIETWSRVVHRTVERVEIVHAAAAPAPARPEPAEDAAAIARHALETAGVTQLTGYGCSKGEALGSIAAWLDLLGGENPQSQRQLLQLLKAAIDRKLEGAAALRWLEQQVRSLASAGGVLPLGPVPAKAVDLKPAAADRRNGKRRHG